jgi:toxin ParE1/3/4
MSLRVLPEAELDVIEASIWYDNARVGLGNEFVDAVVDAYQRIEAGPYHYAARYGDVRVVQTNRFEHGVFFLLKASESIVLAVMHLHRHPDTWLRRAGELQKRGAV